MPGIPYHIHVACIFKHEEVFGNSARFTTWRKRWAGRFRVSVRLSGYLTGYGAPDAGPQKRPAGVVIGILRFAHLLASGRKCNLDLVHHAVHEKLVRFLRASRVRVSCNERTRSELARFPSVAPQKRDGRNAELLGSG